MSDRLAEIRERAEAATEGPWQEVENWRSVAVYHSISQRLDTPVCRVLCPKSGDLAGRSANAAFIAHSRADVAWLVEEVERLRALLLGDTTPTGAAAAGVGA